MDIKINTIEEAIEELKAGKLIIVVDDEDRENEGDFITAAQNVTPEIINFMSKNGRGLICAPISAEIADRLNLNLMVENNTVLHQTPFTVSVDLIGQGCTTGISAFDRAKTVQAIINPNTKPEELGRPGHIFPLRAKNGGVLRRTGHTEATVDLAKLAGMAPAGVLVEIMNDDGTMARLPQLMVIAERFNLKIITIKDLIAYRKSTEKLVVREQSVSLPTEWGNFELIAYRQLDNDMVHIALKKGDWNANEPILTRVHSSCVTGDIFGSCKCDCGAQLHKSMEMVEKEGKGLIIYMNQEGRGIGLINKLKAYHLQELGRDTVEANVELGFKPDERDYGIGAQILFDLNATNIRLITNNHTKRVGLAGYGIQIQELVPLIIHPNPHNLNYLKTKEKKMGHDLHLNL